MRSPLSSFASRIVSAFPTPSFLAFSGAGLDISSGSVKLLELTRHGGGLALAQFAEVDLPPGLITGGDIVERQGLVDVLRRLRSRQRARFVHASLPEQKAFLYRTTAPHAARMGDLRQAVESELEENVPLPPSEAYFDYEVVPSPEGDGEHVDVSVTVYAKRIVDEYASVLADAGFLPLSFEVESQALSRAVVPMRDLSTTLIVDFGKRTTRFVVVSRGAAAFTATIELGGDTLTQAVMKHLGADEAAAEKEKNEKGFIMNAGNKDLYESMMITVSVLKDEIKRHLTYWESHEGNLHPESKVEQVILCGGNANLRGLPEYLAGELQVDVSVANVWANVCSFDEYIPPLTKERSLEYAPSIGLALRAFAPLS
jgi:type IV pilus assembly protein PilM